MHAVMTPVLNPSVDGRTFQCAGIIILDGQPMMLVPLQATNAAQTTPATTMTEYPSPILYEETNLWEEEEEEQPVIELLPSLDAGLLEVEKPLHDLPAVPNGNQSLGVLPLCSFEQRPETLEIIENPCWEITFDDFPLIFNTTRFSLARTIKRRSETVPSEMFSYVFLPCYIDNQFQLKNGPAKIFFELDAEYYLPNNICQQLSVSKTLRIQVEVRSTKDDRVICRRISPEYQVLQDKLHEISPKLSPDVFFFPQVVVSQHIKGCVSKASLSKRHKRLKLSKQVSWCYNPERCAVKTRCSCQAYPSRHIKKTLRLMIERLKSMGADLSGAQSTCEELYAMVCQPATEQLAHFRDYQDFLVARAKRWRLFLYLHNLIKKFQMKQVADMMQELCNALSNGGSESEWLPIEE